MSTTYYQQKWEDAIMQLLSCVDEENIPLQQNRNEKGITYKRTDYEWFQYYGLLYVRYLEIYRKLEEGFDQMVHPQKRILMKEMLENAIVRMCEVKQNLVRYSTQTNIIQSDFINIDEILSQMKLTPKALKVPIPRYFRDGQSQRDKKLKQIVKDLRVSQQVQVFNDDITLQANFQTIIRIIQKLERGRQGIIRGVQIAKLRNKQPNKERVSQNQNQIDVTIIQKYWRAFVARRELEKMRIEELKFLGIEREASSRELLEGVIQQRDKMKIIQQNRTDRFIKEKVNIKKEIEKREEKIIKARMLDQRRKWINKFLEMHEFGNLPNSLSQFYESKQLAEKGEDSERQNRKQEKQNIKPEKPDMKNKKPKKNEVQKFIDEHFSIGPSVAVQNIQKTIQTYSTVWSQKQTLQTDQQYFDINLAKLQIRPEVEIELQKNVDILINLELDCMRIKYGIKKKKEKKVKKNKKKEKKVKIPQGLGKRNPEQLLRQLFETNIAKILNNADMDDYIGTYNTVNYLIEQKAEIQPDPSLPQVKNLVAEYVGIPLGSKFAKDKLEKWNWFFWYGSMGTGKTLLTRALQKQTKALIFDISPNNVKQQYSEKSELTKMIWQVIICAKYFQPSIVVIEDFQTIFPGKMKIKKKVNSNIPNFGPKMKKPVKDLKKNRLWDKNDRITVIGYSNKPYEGAMKYYKKLFQKSIYFPYPNYSTRKLMLRTFLQRKLGRSLPDFPYHTLAHTTEGFTASSYLRCIDKILTEGRVSRLDDQPLKISQFIGPLAGTVCVFADEYEKFKKFTDEVTGLKQRREAKIMKKEEEKKEAAKNSKRK